MFTEHFEQVNCKGGMFHFGHYKSIMPVHLQSRVIQHYSFKKNARTRTLSSLGEPAFSSSKIVESGTEPEMTVLGLSQESKVRIERLGTLKTEGNFNFFCIVKKHLYQNS